MIRRLLIACAAFMAAGTGTARASDANGTQTGGTDTQPRNCDAVTNLSRMEFVYASPTSASVKYIERTTILNRSGNGKGDFTCYVDPTKSLRSFSGTITDAQGHVFRKLKRADLNYTELSSGLADDAACYYLECLCPVYPYTVQVEYECTMKNGILGFPPFYPVTTAGTALEKGVFTLSVPKGMQFGCKSRNIGEPVRSDTPERDIYTWTVENFPAVKPEPLSPPLVDLVPQVLTAPCDFEYAGTHGSMRDWASFGTWMCGLLEGRDRLPEGLKQEVHRRTDSLSEPREKIRALYDYLGESTRYVSIQLGIGGMQPMKAEEVYRTKFGDCKALSNYLKAMLEECGIGSDYVILNTKRSRMYRDFASPAQANHAILRVPLEKDTLWLECTNTDVPLGYVHRQIAGHDAILFRNGAGKFVTLPQPADTLNRMVCSIDITLSEDGSARGRVQECYEGAQYDPKMSFGQLEATTRTDALLKKLKIPMAGIDSVACKETEGPLPRCEVNYVLASQRYFSVSGSRCFLPQTPFRGYSTYRERERLNDLYIPTGYLDIVIVRYRLPEGVRAETLPKPCKVTTPFGSYSLAIKAEGNILTVEQRTGVNRGTYPRETFEQYREFTAGRARAFNAGIVLRKQ